MSQNESNDPKLVQFRDKLSVVQSKKEGIKTTKTAKEDDNENMRNGLRAGSELITAIVAGGLIGYGLDKWLETKPIFLIAMLLFGVITGFVNVWRTTQNMGHSVGYKDQDKQE